MHFSVLKLLQSLFPGTKYVNYDNVALEKKSCIFMITQTKSTNNFYLYYLS